MSVLKESPELVVCQACKHEQPQSKFCMSCGKPFPREHVQPGVMLPRTADRLPHVLPRGGKHTIHWLGVHGGAGESTLAEAEPGSVAAGHGWPIAPNGSGIPMLSVPVVLVARSHARGLTAAQNALREWAAGQVDPARVIGLVIIADAPGPLPKQLRALQKLVSGGAPRVWTIPYIDSYRLGVPVTIETLPPAVNKVRRAIQAIVENQ